MPVLVEATINRVAVSKPRFWHAAKLHLLCGRIGGQIRRQIGARGVDRRLDVARGAVDVAVDVELGSVRGCLPRSFR